MKHLKNLIVLAAAALVCASCGAGRKNPAADNPEQKKSSKTYVIPAIPSMLSDPEAQARHLAQHFWDNFDFTDTTNIDSPEYTEQAFANYVQILLNVPREIGGASVATLFSKAAADKRMFLHVAELAEKYLYEPNSPVRDEEYYITVLESVLASPLLDEWERIRPEDQLSMALRNRPGTRAADFRYTLASGASGTLHGLRAPFTLIFFNNPGCTACKEIEEELEASGFLMNLVESGKLTVLAVYPDEDLDEWHKFAPQMPSEWINSYDRGTVIKNERLYDLKAIPTLYLLDRDKNVMLKDVMSIPMIEEVIYSNINLQ